MQQDQSLAMGLLSGRYVGGDEHQQLLKAEIATHPLYQQILEAHVACLRVATPIDQLPLIDAQLSHSHHHLHSYASLRSPDHQILSPQDKQELDHFLAQYFLVLCSFKDQLQQHVRIHAVDAVKACRDIEQSLQALTDSRCESLVEQLRKKKRAREKELAGKERLLDLYALYDEFYFYLEHNIVGGAGATLGEGTGAAMSDDEEDMQLDYGSDPNYADGQDLMGLRPLLPTESERSLMERVRQELKIELKEGFKSRIEDVREEILRKRRAGKLPGDTTSVLKQWWQQHSKWPYPTEDDKAKLVEETGLQLKQINNWFINQRKRNWHSNSQSMNSLKSKRKR